MIRSTAFVTLVLLACMNAQQTVPYYVRQCRAKDPQLTNCIIQSLHHIRPFVAKGIPEIEMPAVEPFRMDSLSLSLNTGPKGYKITLRDLDIYGASNFTVTKLKLSHNGSPFEAKLYIPSMKIDATYTSSGVLIVLPASGNGTFHAKLGDVTAIVKGTTGSNFRGGKEYINVDKLDINLSIKDVQMSVSKIFNNNRILMEATNLFLQENGQEVLQVMMPQLRFKLAAVFKNIANKLLSHIPLQILLVPE